MGTRWHAGACAAVCILFLGSKVGFCHSGRVGPENGGNKLDFLFTIADASDFERVYGSGVSISIRVEIAADANAGCTILFSANMAGDKL